MTTLVIALAAGCAAPPRPDTPMTSLSAGRIGIADDQRSTLVGVECRWRGFSPLRIVPAIGLELDDEDASYAYVGAKRDFWIDGRWVAVPSFSIGLFDEGDKLQLGSDVEFRSGIELAYVFGNGVRLGAGLYHLSNAGIDDRNPGTESLVVSLGIPFGVSSAPEPR